jgi:hypothetical protein
MYYLNLTFLWLNFGISAMFLFYFNVVQVCRKMKRRKIWGGGDPCVPELCVENPRFFLFEGNSGD